MLGKASISDYYRHIENELRSLVLREKDEKISNNQTTSLIEEYLESLSLPKIVLQPENQKIIPEKYIKRISANERDEMYRNEGSLDFECEQVVVILPIKENNKISDIKRLATSRFSLSWSPERELEVTSNQIKFKIQIKGYGFNISEDESKVLNTVKSKKDLVLEWVNNVNKDIEEENQRLTSFLNALIEERKQKINKDKDKFSSLSDKLNQL